MNAMFISIIICLVTSFLFNVPAYSWSPEGYPYYFLGDLSYFEGTDEGIEDGLYTELYAEQGIDLFELKTNSEIIDQAMFNVFVSGSLLLGGEENRDPWNKKGEATSGFQFRILMKGNASVNEWGEINIGGKINYIDYFYDDIYDNEVRYIGFITWGVSGDWKKK